MGWKNKKQSNENPLSKGFCCEGKYGENGHKYMDSYNNQNAFICILQQQAKEMNNKKTHIESYILFRT